MEEEKDMIVRIKGTLTLGGVSIILLSIRSHCGQNEFQCDNCGDNCEPSDELQRHVRDDHGVKEETDSES